MWRKITGEERIKFQSLASVLMKNPSAFKSAMLRALDEWPFACEANFTAPSVNKQAWVGHAGCCLATGSPEEVTRSAWWTLTQPEQDLANRAADEVIEQWNRTNAKN